MTSEPLVDIRDVAFSYPTREIFKRVCEAKSIPYDERALSYLLQEYYIKRRAKLRAVHPRDLVDQIAVWVPDEAARRRILVDNAERLYGFGR